jgi:hypothetical protein
MSIRNQMIAASALALVAFCGASNPAIAADSKPLIAESCSSQTRSLVRQVGHPGKSALFPQRKFPEQGCSTAPRKPLMLASFTDSPGGRALVAGKTERAIEQIRASKSAPDSMELTNLCVAYTVLREWPEASDTCDAAVASATDERARIAKQAGPRSKMADTRVAVAYSNRAVLNWLSRDEAAAKSDLALARSHAPKARFVMRNADVTVRTSTLAQSADLSEPIG